jgi:hypothetical protein
MFSVFCKVLNVSGGLWRFEIKKFFMETFDEIDFLKFKVTFFAHNPAPDSPTRSESKSALPPCFLSLVQIWSG